MNSLLFLAALCACADRALAQVDPGNAGTAGHAHSDKTGMSCKDGSLVKDGDHSRNDGAHAVATEVETVATNIQTPNIKAYDTYKVKLHLGPKALSVSSSGRHNPMSSLMYSIQR